MGKQIVSGNAITVLASPLQGAECLLRVPEQVSGVNSFPSPQSPMFRAHGSVPESIRHVSLNITECTGLGKCPLSSAILTEGAEVFALCLNVSRASSPVYRVFTELSESMPD